MAFYLDDLQVREDLQHKLAQYLKAAGSASYLHTSLASQLNMDKLTERYGYYTSNREEEYLERNRVLEFLRLHPKLFLIVEESTKFLLETEETRRSNFFSTYEEISRIVERINSELSALGISHVEVERLAVFNLSAEDIKYILEDVKNIRYTIPDFANPTYYPSHTGYVSKTYKNLETKGKVNYTFRKSMKEVEFTLERGEDLKKSKFYQNPLTHYMSIDIG